MKSFIASMIMFGALLGIIVWNYCYISTISADLTQKIEALPCCELSGDAVEDLYDYWERESARISISVSLHTIHKMDDCLTELRYAADHGDPQTFEKNRYLARTIVQEMQDAETPHLKNWI